MRPSKSGSILVLIAGMVLAAGCIPSEPIYPVPLSDDTDRVWIGPEFYANRLQDWRLEDGWIRSVEGRSARPMRTVHLLSHALASADGSAETRVRIAPRPATQDTNTWAGVLLGAGDDSTDFRISVLVHHWPAPGGGLVVAVDGAGRIVLRDNEAQVGRTGPRGDYTAEDWPVIAVVSEPPDDPLPDVVELRVRAAPWGTAYRLDAAIVDPANGQDLSNGRVEGLAAGSFDGTIALVSHGSPLGDGEGYRFRGMQVGGSKIRETTERLFGPVMGTQYTLDGTTLKLTAQFGPLGPDDPQVAHLEARGNDGWTTVSEASIHPNGYTATFRVMDWPLEADRTYRVAYDLRRSAERVDRIVFPGTIRRPPTGKRPFVLAGLNCHHISGGDGSWTHNHFWYPHGELVASVRAQRPDMLFFAGDQIYEGGLAGIVRAPTDTAILDYLNHWYRFVWAFRSLMRDRPTVTIPDDHDVYHGNIWGAGGKSATGPHQPASDNGGYIQPPEFVNAVHRTQTSHLPDPPDAMPIDQGISVYHTTMEYAGISFAILADRMFKSAPRDLIPDARIWNGWPQNPAFDVARSADVRGAELLGPRQEAMLERWADRWTDSTWMKVVLSQTLFSNLATIPEDAMSGAVIPGLPNPAPGEYPPGYKKATDLDSNGWPQTPRDRALRIMRRAFAVHVAGDQHLGSVVRYGVDAWNDGPYAFVLPSIANIWPRRWWPPESGRNRIPDRPRYTGEHLDGFGNRMTVHAVANPVDSGHEPEALYDRTPGYGIVKLDAVDRTVRFEAWPRWENVSRPGARMYSDWPVSFIQEDGYGRTRDGYLPAVELDAYPSAVVRVDDETTGEWLYTVRPAGDRFRPWVFDSTHRYSVRIGDPGARVPKRYDCIYVTADSTDTLDDSSADCGR